MTQMPSTERRAAERFAVALPITMEGEEAATHDLSEHGILLKTATHTEVGAQVALSLQYRQQGIEHQLACAGEVVRVECHGEGYNIAVRLHAPLFAPADVPTPA